MSEDTIEPWEQERLRLFATQQLLITAIAHLVSLAPDREAMRLRMAADFERMATGFDARGVMSPEKIDAVREILLQHGLELLSQVPRL